MPETDKPVLRCGDFGDGKPCPLFHQNPDAPEWCLYRGEADDVCRISDGEWRQIEEVIDRRRKRMGIRPEAVERVLEELWSLLDEANEQNRHIGKCDRRAPQYWIVRCIHKVEAAFPTKEQADEENA